MAQEFFIGLTVVLLIATFFAYIAKFFRQPLIPAYILTGLLLGPVLGLTKSIDLVSLAELGLAFLLFIIGVEFDLKSLKSLGKLATIVTFVQFFIVFSLTYFFSLLLGFAFVPSLYLGAVISLSSTMIVVKLLSDTRELSTLHGRLSLGILIVQDIIAVLLVAIVTSSTQYTISFVLFTLFKGVGFLLLALLASKYLFPPLFTFAAARSQELLFLLSVSVCFVFATLFYLLGFSIAIGAFIGGVVLANLPYNYEIAARIRSLRNFFATLFFVSLGAELSFASLQWSVFLLFFVLAVFLKPLILFLVTSFLGFSKKTAFKTGLMLGQVSEFSLILVTIGFGLGQISREILSYTVLLSVVTIGITPYFLQFHKRIYALLLPVLSFVNKFGQSSTQLHYLPKAFKYDAIICGFDTIGYRIMQTLEELGKRTLIVDYDPEVIQELMEQKKPCLYGDVSDPEVLDLLDLKHTSLFVSTIPEFSTSLYLLKTVKKRNKQSLVVLTADNIDEALVLYNQKADYVVLPHFLGATHVSLLLQNVDRNLKMVLKAKLAHIKELRERHEKGHMHPPAKRKQK